MDIIVAVTSDWGIGNNGELLFSIPEDMKFFRNTTKDSVIIMGRKTLESFPNGKPLKNRVNIVLSHSEGYSPEGVTVCKSIGEVLETLKSFPEKKVFVIGGGSIYSEFLPLCDKAYITRMDISRPADTYFPDLDKYSDWSLTYESEQKSFEGVTFRFTEYTNSSRKSDEA